MARITRPREGEPIRLLSTDSGPRYRVVLDIAPKGAKRKQVTRTFVALSEARGFVTETRERIAKGAYTAPSRLTLRDVAQDWLRTRRDVRQVTVNGYRNALRPALDHLGDRPAQSLTRRDIEGLVEWAATQGSLSGGPLSQRSVVYLLGTVKQVLAFGVASGILPTNVAQGVKPPRRTASDRKSVTVWTMAEMLAFREVADRDPWAVAMRLLLCGLRRSEVLGLCWEDVDTDAEAVRVSASRVLVARGVTATDEPKSAASARVVPVEQMHAGTMDLLRALRARQAAERLAAGEAHEGCGLVVADALGRGVHPDALTARWRTLCAAAGVPVIGTHSVRHTLATALHQAGEAPADVAALLGHEVSTHLAFYVQRTEHGAARAAGRFGEVLAAVR